ncbi:MAG: diacylglycerol kinase family protein [Actinomycetota bacterium]
MVLAAALLCCGDIAAAGVPVLPLPLLGIAVLTNVEAGRNRFGRYKSYGLPEIVGPGGLVEETETMEEIDGAIERMLARGERLICINGGDGTMQRTITHMINKYGEEAVGVPVLFPLRGGTMNLLADHLKIKGKTPDLLRRAVAAERLSPDLPHIEVSTLRVTRDIGGREEREYGFFYGNGALYRFHRVYYRETNGGPVAAAKLFAKCAIGGATKSTRYQHVFGLTPAKVTIDGFTIPADQVTIVLAVMFQVVVISFDAFRDEGEGDFYVIATSVPIFKMARKLHRLLWGKNSEHPPYPMEEFFNRRASRIHMECREGYSLDGEVFEIEEPYTLTIEKGPTVKFLNLGVSP